MIARQALLIFLTNIVGAMAGMAALFAATHYMTPTAVGMFAFTLSLALLATNFTNLGFDRAHIKRLSEGLPAGECLATYAVIKTGLTAIVTMGILVAAVIWARTNGFHDATSLPVIAAGLLFLLGNQARQFWGGTFKGYRWAAKGQALVLLEHLVRAPAFVLVALVFGAASGRWVPLGSKLGPLAEWFRDNLAVTDELGAMALMIAQFLAVVVGFPVAWAMAKRAGLRLGRPSKEMVRSYARFAWPLALLSFLSVVANQVDSLMVGYFWSAPDVAYYYGGQRLVHFVQAIPSAVAILFFAMISELSHAGHRAAVRDLAMTAQRYMGMLMIPLSMFLVVFSSEGTRIALGPSYEASGPILVVLGIQVLLFGFMIISNNLLAGSDLPRTLARVGAVTAGSNVVLNILFIPSDILGVPLLGMRGLGAAYATLIAQVLGLLASFSASRKAIGAYVVPVDWWKQGAAAVVTGTILWMAKPLLIGDVVRVWELLVNGALGVAIYALLLWVLRGLTRKDVLFFYDLVHPGKMGAYVRSELRDEE